MATRSVSPGGALLRASRVFAVPAPLPRPDPGLFSGAINSSDSATLPHPTHLTITTPQASLARGDWGFKRPLPLRSTTRTSTPLIRVHSIDTYEHITEFGSASDHAINLQKWQEMGVPLTVPNANSSYVLSRISTPTKKSVFDDDIDFTTPGGSNDKRWRFKGPWLPGQSEGQFEDFLLGEVRKKKLEFREHLRAACAKELTTGARQSAIAIGEEIPAPIEASQVTEEQMAAFTKTLRETRTTLFEHIRLFFDLPPAPAKKEGAQAEDMTSRLLSGTGPSSLRSSDLVINASPYAENGPPKTHPSAGLSYSRSSNRIFNHPEFGPQKFQPPIQSRVVRPKNAGNGRQVIPALGVGGFVVTPPSGTFDAFSSARTSSSVIPGLMKIDTQKVGGTKVYMRPTEAHINAKGNVILSVQPADEHSIAVLEGKTDKIPVEWKAQTVPSFASAVPSAPSYGNYGLSSGSSPNPESGGKWARN